MARRSLREDDEQGQMMILAAVLLVIGLIALAGMVARVNQLGSQTAIESNQAILGELAPLSDAIDSGVSELQRGRNAAAIWGVNQGTSVTVSTPGTFSEADVGMAVTGTGIPAWTRITAYNPTTGAVTLSTSPTLPLVAIPGTLRVGPFLLTSTSTPTLQDAIVSMLEQMQRYEASHGFVMDYELTCTGVTNKVDGTGGVATQGVVIVHLSDGTVWAEVSTPSSIVFTRNPVSNSCASVYG